MAKYVYTLSSAGLMPNWAFLSIKSLSEYVSREDIVVFFTPPRDEEDIKILESLGVDVRLVKNSTNAFSAFDQPQHYGEKTWVSEIEDSTAVFLDCDTLIFGDISTAIEGDFQFKARPGTSAVRQPEWKNLFERFDEQYMSWMPNAGFIIFKSRLHQKIGEKWRSYINKELNYSHDVNHKEQYALALSIGDADKEKMTDREHVMMWNGEYPSKGLVYHVGSTMDGETPPSTFKGNINIAFKKLLEGNI